MKTDTSYDVLGVTPNADPRVVDAAYQTLVKEHHPDHGGTSAQFQRVKTAYDKIRHEQAAEKGGDQRNSSSGIVEVACHGCGEEVTVKTSYFTRYGEDLFCQNCLVHTQCDSCGTGLRLTHSRYQELGGGAVVCSGCADSQNSTQSQSFWDGTTIGEKIVFVLAVGILGFNLLLLVAGAEGGVFALPSVLLIGWIYHRGKNVVQQE